MLKILKSGVIRSRAQIEDGDGRNLREAFRMFIEVSGSGNTEVTRDLAEC